MLWFQTSKTSRGTMSGSTSKPSSRTTKSGKFTSVSRAIKRSDIHLEVLSLQNRKSFEYSRSSRKRTPSGRDKNVVPLFSPNLRHFSQRFRRIQSWYRFHLHGVRLLALIWLSKISYPKNTYKIFVPKKIPESKISNPQKILRLSPPLEIPSTSPGLAAR